MLRLGVNRLSLGVQSLDDGLLRRMGRVHSATEAIGSYHLARAAGLDNISLDLIYGLPGQNLATWRDTLRGVIDLEPDHLSLYALHLSDEVPMARAIAAGTCPPLDDDLAADMYLLAMDTLADAGYNQYEISNWARESAIGGTFARCRHNLTYWLDELYLGLGCGAHGYVDAQRYWNVSDPSEYIARVARGEPPIEGAESIDARTERSEFMILGLRLIEGVGHRRFAERFGSELFDVYSDEIAGLAATGLLERDEVGIRLTPGRGYLLGNRVFEEFVTIGKD
jgi:oxygen-independent coproporphyrinogen-3 oxidase